MSGLAVGALTIAGGAAWYASDQKKKAQKARRDGGLNLPMFNEYYDKTQSALYDFGSGVLKGDIPDYYKGIGEYGGKEFEDILGLTQRDVSRGVNEDLARRKVRGMRGTDITARAMGDITKKLRWEDYSRSLKGKEFLLTQGRGMLEGVRGGDLAYSGQQNELSMEMARVEQLKEARRDEMWAQIMKAVVSGGVGYATGGASLAAKGVIGGGGSMLGEAGGNLNYEDYVKSG